MKPRDPEPQPYAKRPPQAYARGGLPCARRTDERGWRLASRHLMRGALSGALGALMVACVSPFAGPWLGPAGQVVPDYDGRRLTLDVVEGPNECELDDVVVMTMGWPVGEPATFKSGEFRQYVRDPGGHLRGWGPIAGSFDPDAPLPADAGYSGYHRGAWQLWISESQAARYVYLVSDERAERWPRFRGRIACA